MSLSFLSCFMKNLIVAISHVHYGLLTKEKMCLCFDWVKVIVTKACLILIMLLHLLDQSAMLFFVMQIMPSSTLGVFHMNSNT